MEDILNIPLYNALLRAFEDVKISGRGEQASVRVTMPASVLSREAGARESLQSKGGEYYCVSCPFCSDSRSRRNRLWISYLYGRDVSVDGIVVQGTRHLAHCYNENCLADRDNRWRLWNMIRDNLVDNDSAPIACDATAETAQPEIALPEGCVGVRHPKCPKLVQDYLTGRGFDLDELERDYEVQSGYIPIYAPYPAIIFPVRRSGQLVGWQARQVKKHPEHAPKYFIPSGYRKAWNLFNIDRCSLSDTVMITEGVFDAIQVGGIALMGKKPSIRQTEIITSLWRKILIFPDMDDVDALPIAQEYAGEWVQRGLVESADVIKLPGDDPASTPREVIWDTVRKYYENIATKE